MKVIADSGATKTDWAIVSETVGTVRFKGNGINPFTQDEAVIKDELNAVGCRCASLEPAPESVEIHFYGAGCTAEKAQQVGLMLENGFGGWGTNLVISVNSDLLAAARALCGNGRGIACIMGTGSNSCLYDGETIVENVPPLGYILGDEGSGAALGKLFLRGIFKGGLSETLRNAFLAEYGMTYPQVIERVYRKPMANSFLASIVPFMVANLHDEVLQTMITDSFRDFFRFNIARYGHPELAVNFVGGVAFALQSLLQRAAQAEGFAVGKVMKAPMDGLIDFHRMQ